MRLKGIYTADKGLWAILLLIVDVLMRLQLVMSQNLFVNITKPPEKISSVVSNFGESVAVPLLTSFPKTYTLDTIVAELQVSLNNLYQLRNRSHGLMQIGGIYNPQDVTLSVAKSIRNSLAVSANQLLEKSDACCLDARDIYITKVCNYDYLQCQNLIYTLFGNVCGNGVRNSGEQCDDGNTVSGDGCSNVCTVEAGYSCTGGSSSSPDTCSRSMNQTSGSRRQLTQAGSIFVAFQIQVQFNAVNTSYNLKNVISMVNDPSFVSQFQVDMRSKQYLITAQYSPTGYPKIDLYAGSPRSFFHDVWSGHSWEYSCDRAMTAIGYQINVQAAHDIDVSLFNLQNARKATPIYAQSVSNNTEFLKAKSEYELDIINQRLSGLSDLIAHTLSTSVYMSSLISEITKTQRFIEGARSNSSTDNSSNPCVYLDPFSNEELRYNVDLMVWIKPDGSESVSLTPSGKHVYSEGHGSALPNGKESPTCTDHQFQRKTYSATRISCPCCRDCYEYFHAMNESLNNMPTREELLQLNISLPASEIRQDIDYLISQLHDGINKMSDWIDSINTGLEGLISVLQIIVGILLLSLCSLYLTDSYSTYAIGVTLSGFTNHYDSISRMTGSNMYYGYDSMPTGVQQGVTQFQYGGVIDGFNGNALIPNINAIMNSAMDLSQLLSTCNRYHASSQVQSRWQATGHAGVMTEFCLTEYTSEFYRGFDFSSQSGQTQVGCCSSEFFWGGSRVPAQVVYDYEIYRSELQSIIDALQSSLKRTYDGMSSIKTMSANLEQNITLMMAEAQAEINRLADELLTIGSCVDYNQLYEAVRVPICSNLSYSLNALWTLCLLVALFWLPFFFVLLRFAKILMLAQGMGKVAPNHPLAPKSSVVEVQVQETAVLDEKNTMKEKMDDLTFTIID
eukprot:753264-Hanusia_phi.AAC.3